MIIRISDSSFTTTLSVGSTIANNHGCFDEYSTAVSCLTSTLSTSSPSDNYIYLNSANNYINSLSNEQILLLEKKIEQKEQDTIQIGNKTLTIEDVANLTTTQTPEEQTKPKTYKKI